MGLLMTTREPAEVQALAAADVQPGGLGGLHPEHLGHHTAWEGAYCTDPLKIDLNACQQQMFSLVALFGLIHQCDFTSG